MNKGWIQSGKNGHYQILRTLFCGLTLTFFQQFKEPAQLVLKQTHWYCQLKLDRGVLLHG